MMYRFYLVVLLVTTSGVYAAPEICGAGECHRAGKVGNKNACQCYCSHKCGLRPWENDDPGVFVQNDPHGKGCYCKSWDRENFDTSDNGVSCAIVERQREQEEAAAQKTNGRKIKKKKSVL